MMQGFQSYFVQKIIDVSPHIIMKDEFRHPPLQPIQNIYADNNVVELRGLKPKEELRGIRSAERIVAALEKEPGMAVAPILEGQAFLRYGGKDISTTIIGIQPEKERKVSNLEHDLIEGSLNNLLTTSNGLIIGEGLSRKLGLKMGDKVTLISPAGVILLVKIVGIFSTGITALDNFQSYALLKKVQVLQKRENIVNQIRMRLEDVDSAQERAMLMEQRFGYRTEGWQETNSNVFGIFVIQNGIMYSTVGAILIVAGFGIFNIISTSVNEKHRDIAILKSMGFGAADIQHIFLVQGIIVGMIGTLLGWVLGFSLVELLGTIKFTIEDESFVRLEGFFLYRTPWHYLGGGVMAIISASIAAFLPARKAAILNPVDIIRGAA
jgi:lipoprotein-releasing system permease protein